MGKKRLILAPVGADNKIDPLFNVKTHDQVKKYFLVIARLGEGDYFGVGEDLTKMSIISVKKVGTYRSNARCPPLPIIPKSHDRDTRGEVTSGSCTSL